MDLNLILSGGISLVAAVSFIVTTSVLVNVTRADMKDLKHEFTGLRQDMDARFRDIDGRFNRLEADVSTRFTRLEADVNTRFNRMEADVNARFKEVDTRFGRMEVDVAEIKAICRERSGKNSPV